MLMSKIALNVWLISAAIYQEAANQNTEGQIAVAQVILTRNQDWNLPIPKVINPKAFPWRGKKWKHKMPKAKNKIDLLAQQKAHNLAKAVLLKGLRAKALARGHYTFFNHFTQGRRFKTPVPLVRIGDHVFY